jgi:hypothetical protein
MSNSSASRRAAFFPPHLAKAALEWLSAAGAWR